MASLRGVSEVIANIVLLAIVVSGVVIAAYLLSRLVGLAAGGMEAARVAESIVHSVRVSTACLNETCYTLLYSPVEYTLCFTLGPGYSGSVNVSGALAPAVYSGSAVLAVLPPLPNETLDYRFIGSSYVCARLLPFRLGYGVIVYTVNATRFSVYGLAGGRLVHAMDVTLSR